MVLKKKNYNAVVPAMVLAIAGIVVVGLFILPAAIKWWKILFTQPTIGSIPTWALIVVGIIIIMAIKNKRRTGSYV